MEFSPTNHVVRLCLQGMGLEENGKHEEAGERYLQAWNEAANDFEKFLAAYYLARHKRDAAESLHWAETALQLALHVDSVSAKSALPALYASIAKCYENLRDAEKAGENRALAAAHQVKPSDKGPFYHGTRADLQVGEFLTPGGNSNYQAGLKMNHIYFTALVNGAGLAAALAKGEGRERVYIVEPTGDFENDPNVTDKKFPGNPTRSYRSLTPLRIVGEATEWVRQSPQELQQWRERLATNNGEIIN